jgi:hypothetical protein
LATAAAVLQCHPTVLGSDGTHCSLGFVSFFVALTAAFWWESLLRLLTRLTNPIHSGSITMAQLQHKHAIALTAAQKQDRVEINRYVF